MISLYRYHKIAELAEILSSQDSKAAELVYMLPSRANEERLLDMLWGEGRYFGERPLVWSWSEMYRALTPRSALRRQIDPPDHRLVLKFIVQRNLRALDERGVEVPCGVRRRGFIDILSSAVRELLLEGVDPDLLLCEPRGESGSISTGELLYRLYSDYLLYLEEGGLADNSQLPSLMRASLAEKGLQPSEAPLHILWVGFMSLTGSQLKLARGLADAGTDMTFFVPDAGLKGFHDLGAQLEQPARNAPDRVTTLETLSGEDAYDQYEKLAERIAALFDDDRGLQPPDVGVLVSGGGLQLMTSALRARGIPVQSRAEIPVAETAIVDILRTTWACYERGWPYGRTLSLLCSPLLGLRLDRERIRSAVPEGLTSWRKALAASGQASSALGAFERLSVFCEYLDDPGGHSAEELLRALLDLVRSSRSGWDLTLSRLAYGHADLDPAVREVASAAVEISGKLEMLAEMTPPLGEAGRAHFVGVDAVSFLVEWSRESTTAIPPPQVGAVTLYDAYPPVLTSHDIWAMTDVDPANFPGSSAEHLLLDGALRSGVNASREEGVHLPTLHEKREQSEAVFRRLIATGETLTIVTRALADRQGRPQGESPFLRSYLAETDCRTAEGGEVRGFPPALARIDRGAFPRIANRVPTTGKMRVGASHVDEWLACPFFYWCARIARLERPADITEVFGRIEQGNLLHEIWRSVWRRYLADTDSSGGSLQGVLFRSWEEILKELSRMRGASALLTDARSAPAVGGLKGRMLEIAAMFDESELRAKACGIARMATEFEFKLPEYELDNAVFVGYADRVDVWQDAGSVLVDYKLGSSGRLRGSLQLACYAAMAQLGGLEIAGYCYVSHGDARVTGVWSEATAGVYRKSRGRTQVGLDERIAEALAVMREMDEAIGGGTFPARYDSSLCPRCVYQTVCRRGERFGAFNSGGEPGELDRLGEPGSEGDYDG